MFIYAIVRIEVNKEYGVEAGSVGLAGFGGKCKAMSY